MKVATIVPIPQLELTRNDDYFMCLAHLALHNKEYRDFFIERAKEGKFVLLDNGAAEAAGIGIIQLVELAEMMGVTEVILPDVLRDKEGTLSAGYEALSYISTRKPCRLMVVPQGKTLNEWAQCAHEMLAWPIDTIGVPKLLTKDHGFFARLQALHMIKDIIGDREVHLLGCHDSPLEVAYIGDDFQIRGVDSAIAYVYAKMGRLMSIRTVREQFPIDFEDDHVSRFLLRANKKFWEELCNGKRVL